jgi:hypothetical protein
MFFLFFCAGTSNPTLYVSAGDRLRESPGEPDSPLLPTFHHSPGSRRELDRLNIFLVILNAEIKFHRYLSMVDQDPSPTPLPADVINLMRRTLELVHLLYWKPVVKKGSKRELKIAELMKDSRRNPPRKTRLDPARTIERGSSEEMEMEDDEETGNPTRSQSN